MSTCTSSPHPILSLWYLSKAARQSRARAIAPFGGEPGILFSPFFGNADAARPLPTSCAAHTRCYHTTALPTTSDEGVVDPHSRGCPRVICNPAAIPPWSAEPRFAGSSMIFPKISTSTALSMAERGYMRMRPCPALKAGMWVIVQVLLGHEGSNEPTRSLRGPLLPSQSPATGRRAYRIQKWSISTQLFTRRR